MKIIALEESFWYEKLATEGSTARAWLQLKSGVAADWQRKLVDFTEYRLPDMDRNDVDMQVLSLNSPGIQVQPDPDIAVADARTANDFLVDIIKEHPQRFAGLAASRCKTPPRPPPSSAALSGSGCAEPWSMTTRWAITWTSHSTPRSGKPCRTLTCRSTSTPPPSPPTTGRSWTDTRGWIPRCGVGPPGPAATRCG